MPFKFYEVQSESGPSTTKWTRLDGNFKMIYYNRIHKVKIFLCKQFALNRTRLILDFVLGKDLHNILENLDLKPIFNGLPSQSMLNYKNVKKLWKVHVTYFYCTIFN